MEIDVEEKGSFTHRKVLTGKGVGSIVEKVPRGLRNSQSPEA
jgi:hypothetical protein